MLCGERQNTYRIIFTIREDTEVILHVCHGARDEVEP
jgi:mRNA-degrading endonuclease RelE of RelBE toxin-antitoxin system